LLEEDPRLLAARDPFGNTALIMAANAGREQVVELLFAAGVQPDIHEAAAIGMTPRVEDLLREEPRLVDACPEGFTPLALAAHFGHLETAETLISHGADVNAVSRHELKVTPLHAALFGRRTEVARLLVRYGADVRIKRGGGDRPRAGWTPLHYAAGLGLDDLIELFLRHGADPQARDDRNRTPLDVAVEEKQKRTAAILGRLSKSRGRKS
jgi:ankyrin repeat protein